MYCLWWLIVFQHCYARPGYEKLTAHLNKMIKDEADRKAGEDICIEGLATKSPPSSSFPVMLGDASQGDYKLAKAIHDSTQSGVPIVRGEPLSCQLNSGQNECFADDDFGTVFADEDFECCISHSEGAKSILGQNILSTQESQSDTIDNLVQSGDDAYGVLHGKLKDIVAVVEHDPEAVKRVADQLDKIYLGEVSQLSQKSSGRVKEAGEGLHFSESGTSQERNNKRKRACV
jgi:hypothetical protein